MLTDTELLRRYAEEDAEDEFAALVQRHVNLVYSAALRETGSDASLAEDVTQVVFTELARKASRLCRHPALAGWLYTSVRHVAANFRRARERRQHREQASSPMNEPIRSEPHDPGWEQLRPVLDDAMHELAESDRAAIVLRFFEEQSLKEVGSSLGLNENAARMRVERALEKLRSKLAHRGITSTASGLATALAAGAITAAPSSLAASVAGAALAGAAAAASTSTTLTLLQVMSMSKLKVGAIGVLVTAGIGLPIWQQTHLNHLTAENSRLQSQGVELAALREEADRLRQSKVDQPELERLRGLQSEVLQLRARLGAALRAEGEVAKLRSELASRKAGDAVPGGETNQTGGVVGEMMKNVMEQQFSERLARMKTKLHLTPQQETAIGQILQKQAEQGVQMVQKMFTGKVTKEEMAGSSSENSGDQIKALLSAEQLAAYKDFNNEEAANQVRLAANAELLQVQTSLGLSQVQQDQVFSILYEQGLKQFQNESANPSPKNADPVAMLDRRLEQIDQQFAQKLKALEPVLTPSQLESYRQFQGVQLKMFKSMISGGSVGSELANPKANPAN